MRPIDPLEARDNYRGMGRWLLNNLGTWQIAMLTVGGTVTISAIAHRLVRLKVDPDESHRELAGRLLGVLMASFGLLLAFVVVNMNQRYQDAEANVQFEAIQLSNMYRNSRVFDAPVAESIVGGIRDYIDTILDEERELMARGEMSPDSNEDLVRLFEIVQSYEPKTPTQQAFFGQVVGSLSDLNLARRTRMDDIQSSLPTAFLILIWGGATVLVLFLSVLSSNSSLVQTLMVTAVAAVVGVNLFLVTTLNYPFSGEVSVSLSSFTEGALGQIRAGTAP